jgi:hypothetical protein
MEFTPEADLGKDLPSVIPHCIVHRLLCVLMWIFLKKLHASATLSGAKIGINHVSLLLPTLIPLSGVGKTCFSSCCDKDSAIIFTTSHLPDVNPP